MRKVWEFAWRFVLGFAYGSIPLVFYLLSDIDPLGTLPVAVAVLGPFLFGWWRMRDRVLREGTFVGFFTCVVLVNGVDKPHFDKLLIAGAILLLLLLGFEVLKARGDSAENQQSRSR